MGLDRHQEPGLQGHHLRRGADRARHGEHHAGDGHPGVRRPRRDPRRHRHRPYAAAQQVMDDVAARRRRPRRRRSRSLEDEGVEKFEASWDELLDDVKKSLDAAAQGAGQPERRRQK